MKLHDLSPQILLAIEVAHGQFMRRTTEMVITSVNDGTHGKNSLHAIGHAFDIRVHNLQATKEEIENLALDILEALGGPVGPFDVVVESLGTPNAHIHIEYQPHYSAR